ncbi:cAMP-dependent protein kinase catalytic subunit alpha-like [Galendromus occidentalis]|uniref:cAMP-dependent protein kinase catalytic subunit alpha-like n=1 Tax=Galendromus occidentalis TaxID=34638 RepID=A0AAJ6QV06_9ACAR|nr:cAMP-dependent protein kinase catalytic subunit alpha-like [Galendromus occidentalis]
MRNTISKRAIRNFLRHIESITDQHRRRFYAIYLSDAKSRLEDRLDAGKYRRETLENFDILGRLGEGAFGIVLLARYKADGALFAIKVLDKFKMEVRGCQNETIRERNLAASVQTNFVVRALYSFQDPHNAYIVTEFAEYGDLNLQFVAKENVHVSEKLIKLITAQIVLAIEYLHACSILHRDLKPANVLLFKDGCVKVSDLGCSKKIEHYTTTFQGTIEYCAPEVIIKKPYGKAVDWWSLGAMLFDLVFKEPPFGRKKTGEEKRHGRASMMEEVCTTTFEFPEPSEFPNITMSGEFKNLICELLAPDANARLGGKRGGAKHVRAHSWFREINFLTLFFGGYKNSLIAELPDGVALMRAEPPAEVPRSEGLCEDQTLFADF